jgi:hypothetical protein
VARDTFNDFYMVPIADIINDIVGTLEVDNVTLPGCVQGFKYVTLGELLDIMGPSMSISAIRRRLDLTCAVADFRARLPSEVSSIMQELARNEESPLELLKRQIGRIQKEQSDGKRLRNMARIGHFLEHFACLAILQDNVAFGEATFQDATVLITASAAFLFTVRYIC